MPGRDNTQEIENAVGQEAMENNSGQVLHKTQVQGSQRFSILYAHESLIFILDFSESFI